MRLIVKKFNGIRSIIKYAFIPDQRRNLYKVSSGVWVATTQAGFNKIVKELMETHDDYEGHPTCYPTCYPTVVTYKVQYKGCFNVIFNCVPLTAYQKDLEGILIKLKIIDSEIRIREGMM